MVAATQYGAGAMRAVVGGETFVVTPEHLEDGRAVEVVTIWTRSERLGRVAIPGGAFDRFTDVLAAYPELSTARWYGAAEAMPGETGREG